MTCIPQHIACGWYSPKDGSPPGFVAGNESCILTSFSETRARSPNPLGGTFFRSIAFGPTANKIQITARWVVNAGSPVIYYIDGTHTILDVERVELTISIDGTPTEIYYQNQSAALTGSPPTILAWVVNAIPGLQTQLSVSSSLVIMPDIDKATWDFGADIDNHLSEFTSTSLTGGSYGNPVLTSIRTGPALSMIFIAASEDDDGNSVAGNFGIRYWNGTCWKLDDLINPDCVGSPPDCTGDGCSP